MKAILYVAGRGNRLGPDYVDTHKVLLAFGGKTLLEWHAVHLKRLGISELVVITGHKRELVEAELERVAAHHGLTTRTLHNPDFLDGSVLSFRTSIPELEGLGEPVLLMDGDVLYPTEILRRLVESKHPTALLIDQEYSTDDDDPVLVPIVSDRPVDFRKKWTGQSDVTGESIGFFKVSPEALGFLIERTNARSKAEHPQDSYDDVLRDMVLEGLFGHEDVTGMAWTEIDFLGDIERARTDVLPHVIESK
ncbi:MAG: NTP transferase domain-containing protein [Chrysiogenetes bacterium]|nr:NTP transferase domain-containing protein [Chrysiogenetes bacterium]